MINIYLSPPLERDFEWNQSYQALCLGSTVYGESKFLSFEPYFNQGTAIY
jgi:hypothetical protein